MPALPNVPKVIKTAIKQTLSDVTAENILYWLFTGTNPTVDVLTTFLTAVWDKWAADMMTTLSNESTLFEVTGEDLTSATGASSNYSTTPVPGSVSSGGIPANGAFVCKKEIARRYRGGHPRIYVAGAPTAYLANAYQFTPAHAAGMAADFTDFVNDVVSAAPGTLGTVSLVNVSYYTDHALRAVPVIDPIMAFSGEERLCSQRRRLGPLSG